MELATPGIAFTLPIFLGVLSLIVFIHELGHYLAARSFGVRVEIFSIGFGSELFGWNDRHGTRWRISALPLGGYVKFYGDQGVASAPDAATSRMSAEQRAVSFHHKPVWQRAIISAAGPLINILTAVLIYAGFIYANGQPFTPAVVTGFPEISAARDAGFEIGDRIIAIDDNEMSRFEDVKKYVVMRPERELAVTVQRDGKLYEIKVTPRLEEEIDRFGNRYRSGYIGAQGEQRVFIEKGPFGSLSAAIHETKQQVDIMITVIAELILGKRSIKELTGPVGLAKLTGEQASLGWERLIYFIGFISVNLGVFNLLPIPMLDGGHLTFYAWEAIRGRPLSQRAQEIAILTGLAMVATLFITVTFNDFINIGLWDRLSGLFS